MFPGKCNSQEQLSDRKSSAASVIAKEAKNYRQDRRCSFKSDPRGGETSLACH